MLHKYCSIQESYTIFVKEKMVFVRFIKTMIFSRRPSYKITKMLRLLQFLAFPRLLKIEVFILYYTVYSVSYLDKILRVDCCHPLELWNVPKRTKTHITGKT